MRTITTSLADCFTLAYSLYLNAKCFKVACSLWKYFIHHIHYTFLCIHIMDVYVTAFEKKCYTIYKQKNLLRCAAQIFPGCITPSCYRPFLNCPRMLPTWDLRYLLTIRQNIKMPTEFLFRVWVACAIFSFFFPFFPFFEF